MVKRLTIQIITVARTISWTCGLIAAIATVCLILLTVCDVFLRFVFSKPINGSFELTEYLMVVIVFMAIPWATMRGVHVRVDILTRKLPKRKRVILYSISCILSMVITYLFARYTFPEAMYAYDLQFKSDMLDIPSYPFYFIIMIDFCILLFLLLVVFIQYTNEAIDK